MVRFSICCDSKSSLRSSPMTGRYAGSQYGYDSAFAYQNAKNDEQRQLAIIGLLRDIHEAKASQRKKGKSTDKRAKVQDHDEDWFPTPASPAQDQDPLDVRHVLAMREWSAHQEEDSGSRIGEWIEEQSVHSNQGGDDGELDSLGISLPKDVPPIDPKYRMVARRCGSRFIEHLQDE